MGNLKKRYYNTDIEFEEEEHENIGTSFDTELEEDALNPDEEQQDDV